MIDIHTHLLPQIDDGPSDWEDSLALIRQGMEDGIRGAVCTSHVLNRLDDDLEGKLQYKFAQLQDMVQRNKLNFQLWLGSEVHCQANFNAGFKTATINGNGKYIMIELPLASVPENVGDMFFQMQLKGVAPILVHPERNSVLASRIEKIFSFVQRGVLVQVNAGSLTGDFGKKVRQTAVKMLDHGLVHFVASDCHSTGSRPMKLSKAYSIVSERCGRESAQRIFSLHPRQAIEGDAIQVQEPLPLEKIKRRWFSR
jgi:protein-tyrosine phosphatase